MLERAVFGVTDSELGDNVTLKIPGIKNRTLKISGSINDLDDHPATMHHCVYAYVSTSQLKDMGLSENLIDFTVTGDLYNKDNIEQKSNDYIKLLEKHGYTVLNLSIADTPGVSMHLSEYKATLFILQGFSIILFFFGCLIMGSLLSSILAGQIRQIGILKAIGAKTKSIFLSYILSLGILVAGAVTLSLLIVGPLSTLFSTAIMSLANITPSTTSVPFTYYLLYGGIGLLSPLLLVTPSILRILRIHVRDAITSYGISADIKRDIPILRSLHLSPARQLSIKNALGKRSRFWLNVLILSVGGSLFIAMISCLISTQTVIQDNSDTLQYDYQISCSTKQSTDSIQTSLEHVSDISSSDIWNLCSAKLLTKSGQVENSYTTIGLEHNSKMKDKGLKIIKSETKDSMDDITMNHFLLTLQTLIIVIALILAVALFGLTATMNIQISGRTKEIGIMKAMGATGKNVRKIIVGESVFIGLFSWVISVPLSLVACLICNTCFGEIILDMPISFYLIPYGIGLAIWLIASLLIGVLASRRAVSRALTITIRDSFQEQ